MRAGLACSAVLLALGGPAPALLCLGVVAAIHIMRSPDRLLDALFVAAFCGIGYAAG